VNGRPPARFIVGFGRSGNTLLRLMLDSHPALAIPPESDFIPVVADAPSADVFLERLFGHWRMRDLQVDTDAIAHDVRRLRPFGVAEALRVVYRA
jgi:Sulfotransferase family